MPLCLRRQRLPCPACKSQSLGITHIDRPTERKRQLFEHAAIIPFITAGNPEKWMGDGGADFPSPIFGSPQTLVVVSVGAEKFQKLTVGHGVGTDSKGRNRLLVLLEFIVPAKLFAIASLSFAFYSRLWQAKSCGARRDIDKV